MTEFGWLPNQGVGGLPGQYKMGGYFNSSLSPDVLLDVNGQPKAFTGLPFQEHDGCWGAYFLATQMIYREQPDSRRGLSLFGAAVVNDPQTAVFGHSFEIGAVYQGPFHRDDDYAGLAFIHGAINNRRTMYQEERNIVAPGFVGVQKYEAVFEADYNVQLASWFSVRPDLQYIMNPGATGKIPNALVLALTTRITF